MDVNLWAAAAPYLSHLAPEYWVWDDDATAITWVDGPTITFRQELALVLQPHLQRGLPPLVPLLLILAARRTSWPVSASRLIKIVTERSSVDRHMPEWIGEVLTALEAIHVLPSADKFDPRITADLVEYLFNDWELWASTPEAAAAVVELLSGSPPREWLRVGAKAMCDLWHELGVLRQCLRKFSPEAFARWRQTSVPAGVEPAEPDLPPNEQVRSLLVNLSADAELGGVARLARQVLALVTLPRPVSQPDGMPLGGYSDIANRGSLDRLLISELAHDDLTLAVRVANNEALYVRRETPPSPPPAERLVLLDSGVRMWGVPRVYAAAVGLALAAGRDKSVATRVFRASSRQLAPVECTTRAGIDQHLKALETEAHPAAALDAFADERDQAGLSDVVLVTSDEALADADFLKAWWRVGLSDAWLIAVNRSGRLRLLRGGRSGFVPVREAQLDLEKILTPAAAAPLKGAADERLPAFCRLTVPPLRTQHDPRPGHDWFVPGKGVLALTKDGRLLWWDNAKYGARQIANGLPRGRLLWSDPQPCHGAHQAVIGSLSPHSLYLLTVDFDNQMALTRQFGRELTEKLGADQMIEIVGTETSLFAIGNQNCGGFTREGLFVGSLVIPRFGDWLGDRYFGIRSEGKSFVVALASDGRRLDLMPMNTDEPPRGWLHVAQVGDNGALKAVTMSGELLVMEPGKATRRISNFKTGRLVNLLPMQNARRFAISRDRARVVALTADDRAVFINLEFEEFKPGAKELAQTFFEPDRSRYISYQPSLRKHLRGIAVRENRLTVVSPKDRELEIANRVGGPILRDIGKAPAKGDAFRPFEAVEGIEGLLKANWPDGSEAWLDARGLLHLRSSHHEVPELTIVLHDGQMAGWCSNGKLFGNAHFVGPEKGDAFEPLTILADFVRQLT